jgi:septal ring factor EnvC (AmiA/AmiB activator)
MKSYKDPSFQDRVGRAADAKQKALDNLRSKPPVDEKIVAERQAARLKRETAEAEKRAARKAAESAAKEAAVATAPTEAERKLARDARYAARKNRQ